MTQKRMEKNLDTGSQNWTMERGKSENNQDSLLKQGNVLFHLPTSPGAQ